MMGNERKILIRKVNIPRQSRGLYLMSRSKRLFGVANAAPVDMSRLKAAKEFTGATTTVPTLHDLIFLESRNLHIHETPPHQTSSIRFSCYTSNLRMPSPKN